MALGDLTMFEEFALTSLDGTIDIDTHDLKLAIFTSTAAPAASDTTPTYSDYSTNEVANGNGYTTGGETLTYAGVDRWTEADGTATLDADNVTWSQNASGFTDGDVAILYSDTATNKDCICFIDLDGPASLQSGDITVSWNASGILTCAVA